MHVWHHAGVKHEDFRAELFARYGSNQPGGGLLLPSHHLMHEEGQQVGLMRQLDFLGKILCIIISFYIPRRLFKCLLVMSDIVPNSSFLLNFVMSCPCLLPLSEAL